MQTDDENFEEPILKLRQEYISLEGLGGDSEKKRAKLEKRIEELQADIYSKLTAWQETLVARHPQRPYTLDFIKNLTEDFQELRGDRRFGDDPAIVAGTAVYHGRPVVVIGHQKGRNAKERIERNFGGGSLGDEAECQNRLETGARRCVGNSGLKELQSVFIGDTIINIEAKCSGGSTADVWVLGVEQLVEQGDVGLADRLGNPKRLKKHALVIGAVFVQCSDPFGERGGDIGLRMLTQADACAVAGAVFGEFEEVELLRDGGSGDFGDLHERSCLCRDAPDAPTLDVPALVAH